jgi:hypothetical protein
MGYDGSMGGRHYTAYLIINVIKSALRLLGDDNIEGKFSGGKQFLHEWLWLL